MPSELPIPKEAKKDRRSREMIRAWIAAQGLHCSLRVGMWQEQGIDEPSAWGILLADVTRHVANAMAEDSGKDVRETIQAIREEFLIELGKPTSEHRGRFANE